MPGPPVPAAERRPAPRVVSLLPSATEMVWAVGAGPSLVGVSHECDHPAEVRGLPVVTSTRIGGVGSGGPEDAPGPGASAAIDRDVRRVLRDALAVYEVRTDVLARLAPDVIVTQDLCDVCAVSLPDVQRAVREVLGGETRIVDLHPTRLADIWEDLLRVGAALGRDVEAEAALAALRARVSTVRERAAAAAARGGRPRVLTIEWLDPVMVGGTWMPELVELAGGTPLVTRPGERAPTLAPEQLAALDPAPDVVVVKPCGFDLQRTLAELPVLDALLAGLAAWPAVRSGAVWIADGNAFFNRPGPRIVDSLEILAACLHPAELADLGAPHAGGFVRRDRAGGPG